MRIQARRGDIIILLLFLCIIAKPFVCIPQNIAWSFIYLCTITKMFTLYPTLLSSMLSLFYEISPNPLHVHRLCLHYFQNQFLCVTFAPSSHVTKTTHLLSITDRWMMATKCGAGLRRHWFQIYTGRKTTMVSQPPAGAATTQMTWMLCVLGLCDYVNCGSSKVSHHLIWNVIQSYMFSHFTIAY